MVYSVRDGEKKSATFERGVLVDDPKIVKTDERNGTFVEFYPDEQIFKKFAFKVPYIEKMIWNYCYLNRGLAIYFNGEKFQSKNGLKDLLRSEEHTSELQSRPHLVCR